MKKANKSITKFNFLFSNFQTSHDILTRAENLVDVVKKQEGMEMRNISFITTLTERIFITLKTCKNELQNPATCRQNVRLEMRTGYHMCPH